jgi:glucan-binding YG repeat protein
MNERVFKRTIAILLLLVLLGGYMFPIPAHAETGWVEKYGNWYYYDENGNKVIGWLELNGYKYYLKPESSGNIAGTRCNGTRLGTNR